MSSAFRPERSLKNVSSAPPADRWNGPTDVSSIAFGHSSRPAAGASGGRRFRIPPEITSHRKQLPVFEFRDEFLEAVQRNNVLIVMGETGSGKTTQLPQYLYEAGFGDRGVIGITLPRYASSDWLLIPIDHWNWHKEARAMIICNLMWAAVWRSCRWRSGWPARWALS